MIKNRSKEVIEGISVPKSSQSAPRTECFLRSASFSSKKAQAMAYRIKLKRFIRSNKLFYKKGKSFLKHSL